MIERNGPRAPGLLFALVLVLGGAIPMLDARAGTPAADGLRTAILGGGCFWCLEAYFEELAGVRRVESGYAGGVVADPTYKQVCSGATGHAEVVQLTYDPRRISYEEILTVFFGTHDPTTLNRQGADVGTQYRSIILYADEEQRRAAEALIRELEREKVFPQPIVTELAPLEAFYPAEEHHQEYFARNPQQPYCQFVIAPKLEKLRQRFADKLKR
jgi:peptide-methionine (S)-S-oxide reductase